MHIVILGNPVDGFRFVGPFPTKGYALDYYRTDPTTTNIWIAELDAPADPADSDDTD